MIIDISRRPAEICCCHSHSKKDTKLCKDLVKQFSPLLQSRLITLWHPEDIKPGEAIEQETLFQIYTADIVLLLISADFFASPSCRFQMDQALKLFYSQQTHVISVLLRPVSWRETPIFHLPSLPSNERPITEWSNQEKAIVDVVREIKKIIMQLYASFFKERRTSEEKQKLFVAPSILSKQSSSTSETYSSSRQLLTASGLVVKSKYKLSKSPDGEIIPVHLPLGISGYIPASFSIRTDDIKSVNSVEAKIITGGVLLHADATQMIDSNEIAGDIYIQY